MYEHMILIPSVYLSPFAFRRDNNATPRLGCVDAAPGTDGPLGGLLDAAEERHLPNAGRTGGEGAAHWRGSVNGSTRWLDGTERRC